MKKNVLSLVAIMALMTLGACGGSTSESANPSNPTTPSESVETNPSETETNNPTETDPTTPPTESPSTPSEGTDTDTDTETPVVNDPVITVEGGVKEFTVAAGEELTLPKVTATGANGNDLTDQMDVEDIFESGTIKDGKFVAQIAGDHEISYYVEEGDKYAEEFIVITVTPAHEETNNVEGFNDPAVISEYGTFKENFQDGTGSPFAYTDSNNAAKIVGTEEAIAGNSLIIDMNKTAGSANNAVFFNAFNESFIRGKQVTYTISFDYKILTDAKNFNDVYVGLSWDEFDGLNNQFVKADAEKGQVYHYSTTFLSTSIPMTGNAYFFLFKLSGSSDPLQMAFDNFEVSAKETVQVNPYEPSAEELEAGVTWVKDKGATATNGETVKIDTLDEELKGKLQATAAFGENALRLINADGHLFSGLTKNNMIAGKKLTIEMEYYNINDNGLCFIMMSDNGNPTLDTTITETDHGTKLIKFEGRIQDGSKQLNIYGANNPAFEIYIASIKATLSEADPIPEDQTPNGHKVGDSWTVDKRQWGNENKLGFTMENFDNNEEVLKHPEMGADPTKISFTNVTNASLEWFQANGTLELNQKYEVTFTYYVTSWNAPTEGQLMYNIDNQQFVEVGQGGYQTYMSLGFHQETITLVPTKQADFFSFFVPGTSTIESATIYVAGVTYTLTEIVK